jgi:hypothetical protein
MTKAISALIFGHSHAWSLRRAIDSGEYVTCDPGFDMKVILCGTQKFPSTLLVHSTLGSESINPALLSALADYPSKLVNPNQEIWLISAVQGNYYNIVGMLDEGAPFDFVMPGHEDLPFDINGHVIPYGAVVESIAAQTAELAPFYKRLSRLGYTGIIHLGAPPPHPSSDKFLEQLSADPKLAGKVLGVSAAPTRLKLWLAQERVLTELCRTAGVIYRPAPAVAADENGYLRQPLCKDAVHGTSAYAQMALEDLAAYLATHCVSEKK